jgi:transcriptional regulator with GAF, ATPase, and Fis domain
MRIDRNEFFRNATLQICSSLDSGTALLNFLMFIREFMPVSVVYVALFERNTWNLRDSLIVDHAGNIQNVRAASIPKEAVREMESIAQAVDITIWAPGDHPAVAKAFSPYIDLHNHYRLGMKITLETGFYAIFSLVAEGNTSFTKEHLDLVSLLREPLSIAVSNGMRYREVVDLKDIVDAENRELNRQLRLLPGDEIIGAEYGLKASLEMVREVAPLNSPVVLLGETGVGKEVIADAIHHTSPRKDGPLVKVNCGGIPENLIDSELFGHERGAFTGAIAQKRGHFERADRGTIFLDEIGELPVQAQVRLLRVLQQKEIMRVGGTKTITVDVRVVAATHRDIEELVRTGAFREDLWFRLNVFPIVIPPLRNRKEDMPALIHHFIKKKSKELKIYPAPAISIEEVERLKAYHWPGNVRELENLIERELIHTRGKGKSGPIKFEHFEIQGKSGESDIDHFTGQKLLTLEEVVQRHISQALQTCNGRISGPMGAAQLLGINSNTLRSRMRKLGIPFKYS